jgi:hypothetical protein
MGAEQNKGSKVVSNNYNNNYNNLNLAELNYSGILLSPFEFYSH